MHKCLIDDIVGLMLSVAKLTPGQESYYERSVAAGMDDYYAGRGESPGMWVGRGAAALALEGVVAEGQLGLLVRGSHPVGGEQLRRHYRPRTITIERIDPHAGTRRTEQKKLAPVAGFDLVFSPPKSVSLLHALGDEHARRAVNEAHTAAWQAALGYLEDEACITRRGKNGVLREHGGGFVAAAYHRCHNGVGRKRSQRGCQCADLPRHARGGEHTEPACRRPGPDCRRGVDEYRPDRGDGHEP